jgi:hypothetical protein
MSWLFKPDPSKDALIIILKDEIAFLRKQHANDIERVDRLMEALSRKANIDLIMPQPVPVVVERTVVSNPWKDPNLVTSYFEENK